MRRAPWIVRPVIGALLALLAGCGSGAAPGPSVPTFPESGAGSAAASAGSAAHDSGVVPDDCSRILQAGELVAVLGMPLGSVVMRTVVGLPAPSVGRTERMDCAYSGTAAAGPDSGKRLLAVNAAAYSTPAAARAQWTLNTAREDGVHRDEPVGAAPGLLVERPGETLLAVQYGSGTVTIVLPDRPLPPGRTPEAMLVDLARRVLPTMAGAVSPPTPAPTPTPTPAPSPGPVRALR